MGAICRVTVPATIIRSGWRGLGRKMPAPNRSISKRDAPVAIISIAQQARPKVIGQRADFRAQLNSASTVVVMIFFSNLSSIHAGNLVSCKRPLPYRLRPVEGTLLDDPDVSDDEYAQKYEHLHQTKQRQLLVYDGPREQKYGLDIENHEEDRHNVIADRVTLAGIRFRIDAALIRR